ncbi:MAG: hypothetical protein K0R72_337 [Clostridia bacterium]|jgi:HD-GYP domain-containing protein (c-di-GMP phosphodiesterase class II)|nr:hypothetical protein [Clostridia bacterium]
MNLFDSEDKERFEKIMRAQNATIEITEELAEILEFYMRISKKLSFADVYQTYRRIIVKVKNDIDVDDKECLQLMKRSITILLEVWEYKNYLLEVINELNERFDPIMSSCNQIISEIFCNTNYKMTNHKIDVMFLLFESDLKIEYKGSLQKELSDIYKQTVNTLINTIDIKDSYTGGHSERVSIIAEKFAKTLDMPQKKIEELVIASKLHDVGKIGISEAILTKKGSLSVEEYNTIKKHTEYGETIVKGITGFENISKIIKYHHERYDGKGYYNLPSACIPESVYIICLCDAFDTMSSNRSYRNSLSFDSIIAEYMRCSGTQFEPVLCSKFINFLSNNMDELKDIYMH